MIAGSVGGRRLKAPAGGRSRPTSDRVREAVFSSLTSMDAIADARVLDLFAGSGALGIEALSRGAKEATFVDSDPAAAATVRANLASTGLEGTVVRGDAVAFLIGAGRFDLALLDPPYDFDRWNEVLSTLQAGVVVLESDREVELGDRWEILRCRRYGGTVVTVARATD